MKVCIIGASGKLGRYMVQHALNHGHEVVAVCRSKSVGKLAAFRDRITIVPGYTNDREVIRKAVTGCDGVLTVLFPWGRQHYASGTAQAVLDLAPPEARLVFSCGWFISRDEKDVRSTSLKFQERLVRLITMVIPFIDLDDFVQACQQIFASNTRWTVVRGSDLEEGESEGLPVWSKHVGDPILASNRTRRIDFALFMLEALQNDALIHEAPAIVSCRSPSALAHAHSASERGQSDGRMNMKWKFIRSTTILATTALAVIAVGLLVLSPGRPPLLHDDTGKPIPGGLSEKAFVEINGVQQGMFIQGADPSNPVLLFLHGGPGMPFFFINETYPTGLERDFTVVWLEQRGAGISFSSDIPPASMMVDQMIADTITVTDYLRKRFKQDKIILLGHSWGSFLGIQVAQRASDRFRVYVGMGQVSYQQQSEVAAHDYLLGYYRAQGDTAMVRRLEEAPASLTEGLSDNWMRLRDEAIHRAGVGTTRDMESVITDFFIPSLRSPAYTIREKINIWRGKTSSRCYLWDTVLRTDLTERVTELNVPVYFFSGLHDYTTSHELARAYFMKLKAPVKGLDAFKESAHSPLFEEPERARKFYSKTSCQTEIISLISLI